MINDILTLVSFSVGNYVTWASKAIFKGDRLVSKKLSGNRTFDYNYGYSVLFNDRECNLKNFIENAYSNYRVFKEDLGLNAVIRFFVSSKSIREMLEVKYLIALTSLECLTSYLSSYFKKKEKKVDLGSFKKRLIALFREFSIAYTEDELDFIKTRNTIIHTGKFPVEKSPLEEYHKVINLIDRIILKILGYRGRYVNIKNHRTEKVH